MQVKEEITIIIFHLGFFFGIKKEKLIITRILFVVPLYHKYAPESVKQHGQLLIQWCNTQIRIFTPIVVQWVNANVKTFCNIIAEKAKSSEKKKAPSPSTNGTSTSTSNEEINDASKTEEKKEKILEKD